MKARAMGGSAMATREKIVHQKHVTWLAAVIVTAVMGAWSTTMVLATDDHLLLCEAVLTPTDGEYIEIVNFTGAAVDLENYYLSDDEDYALLPGQFGTGPAPGIGSSDFIVRFPAGSMIADGQVVTVAFNGTGFFNTYGILPDYEIVSVQPGVPDMVEAYTGSVGFAAGLTNGGEHAVLFFWDGMSDLVQDVDAVNIGTPSSTNDVGDKSGLMVDGPDADAVPSTYTLDSGLMPLQFSDPGAGVSTKRILAELGQELSGGGNGITGDDETSENIAVTWDSLFTPPDPGVCDVVVGEPSGACCNTTTFVCTDDVDESACQAGDEEFSQDLTCLDVICEPVGACCLGGQCYDDVTESDCQQSGGSFGAGASCGVIVCGAVNPTINEIRIDQELDDDDEYVEFRGTQGTDLSGLTYIVIGDDEADITLSGTVEAVVPLTGMIGGTGFYTVAEDTFSIGVADQVLNGALDELNLENNDNVTHLLVSGWNGALGDDLDTNDDGTLDVTPWASIVDCVSVIQDAGSGDRLYCAATVGPDGVFAPGHVLRCNDAGVWQIGDFFVGFDDSPGATNDAFCGACCDGEDCQEPRSQIDCAGQGAVYQGDESTCAGVNCSAGACCTACVCEDGLDQSDCEAQAGEFQGIGVTCLEVSCDQTDVVITEIMFNPASQEGTPVLTEWIEVSNRSLSTANVAGWTIADEDGQSDPIGGAPVIAGLQTAVLIPAETSVADFQAAWGTGFQIIQVSGWGNLLGLANDPSPSNEILSIRDASGLAVDVVNFDDELDWPEDTELGGPSLRLSCNAYDCQLNDNGGDWEFSALGLNGGFNNVVTSVFDGLDTGSPGVVPCPDDGPGACCRPDETCFDTSEQFCLDSGFNFFGVGSRCLLIECPPVGVLGACCIEGTCQDAITDTICNLSGGTFFGEDSLCEDLATSDCPATIVIISEVVEGTLDNNDGTGPSNQPRWIELTNTGCAPANMAAYSVGNFNNGSGQLSAPSVQLSGILEPGDSYVVGYSAEPPLPIGTLDTFFDVYGFQPDAFMGGGFFDGNDALALFLGTTNTGGDVPIVDLYGVIGEDGGAWSNVDTTARRNAVVNVGNGGTFNLNNWTLDPTGSLQGIDDAESISLLQSLTNPGVHTFDEPICGAITEIPLADDRFDVNGLVKACSTDADCEANETGPDPETVCRDGACYVARQRSLSIRVNPLNAGLTYSYRVSLDTGVAGTAVLGFAGTPSDVNATGPGPNLYHLTRIEAAPHYQDWSTLAAGIVTLSDCEVSPGNSYLVQTIADGLDVGDEDNYSLPLNLPTPQFNGDVTGGGSPGDPPNGLQGNLIDVFAQVLGFQGVQNEPKDWLDTEPNALAAQPNLIINLADAFAGVQAFQQNPYPGPAPVDCP
ncbi:MAG: lamin tail domain-containing protein [Phycisphaerae bacterium]